MKACLLEWISGANPLTLKALSLIPSYRIYREMYTLLGRSQWWSQEELTAYQTEALSRLLDHAYENVPYYRRVFDDRSLVPGDIQTPDELHLLPFLTKEIVQTIQFYQERVVKLYLLNGKILKIFSPCGHFLQQK